MRIASSLEHPVASRAAARYREALLAGDADRARQAVDEAVAARLPLPALLLDVLAPAQREVGERWHRGELSVAAEHWATETTARQVDLLRPAYPAPRDLGAVALVAAPQGERHDLPARIVAALLGAAGWRCELLGADLPAADLVRFAGERRADLVALSVTQVERLPAAAETATALAAATPAPALLLGGAAFGDPPRLPEGFPSGAVVASGRDAATVAARLLGRDSRPDLTTYLATVGARVARLRHGAGLSQAQLAGAAGLARSYLSAVEGGRQNISLEAALGLARGLDVPLAELLREEADPLPAPSG